MVREEHEHSYVFNDDGFQVCELCGICTTLREHHFQPYFEMCQEVRSEYADVLVNHNLEIRGSGGERVQKAKDTTAPRLSKYRLVCLLYILCSIKGRHLLFIRTIIKHVSNTKFFKIVLSY